jgi:hypothetical protein
LNATSGRQKVVTPSSRWMRMKLEASNIHPETELHAERNGSPKAASSSLPVPAYVVAVVSPRPHHRKRMPP